MNRLKNIITVTFFAILVLSFLQAIFQNWDQVFTPVNLSNLETQYQQSQYVNPDSTTWMDDPELFTYAGIKYLQGQDPASINFETQPLTKYFLGIFTQLFSRPVVFQLLIGILLLYIVYQISRQLLPFPWAVIPSIMLVGDQLFIHQITHAYMDLFQTLLIVLVLYFTSQTTAKPKVLYYIHILIGLVALSKTFSIAIILIFAIAIYLFFTNRTSFVRFLLYLWIPAAVYLAGYAVYFFYHPNLLDFLKLHLNIIRLYRSYVPEYPPGEIYRIIFTGQWLTWYGDHGLRPAEFWSALWPISVSLSLALGFASLRRPKTSSILSSRSQVLGRDPVRSIPAFGFNFNHVNSLPPLITLHLIWFLTYLLFISFRLVFPRYLMPILPSIYILSSYVVYECLMHMRKHAKMRTTW